MSENVRVQRETVDATPPRDHDGQTRHTTPAPSERRPSDNARSSGPRLALAAFGSSAPTERIARVRQMANGPQRADTAGVGVSRIRRSSAASIASGGGERAPRESRVQRNAATSSPVGHHAVPVVQRQVTLKALGAEGAPAPATSEAVLEFLAGAGAAAIGDVENIYVDVLRGAPAQLQQEPALKFLDVDAPDVREPIVRAWVEDGSGPFEYPEDANGARKLLRDAFKFHLHSTHNWRTVGVAQYMTGDATGLALAPLVDPALSVKVLAGKKDNNKTPIKEPSFLTGGDVPEYFAGAVGAGAVTVSNKESSTKYKGTFDRYRKKYNTHVAGATKPWNKETWEATKVLGDALHDEASTEIIRDQIRLGTSPGDGEQKARVARFKKDSLDEVVGGRRCVFIWGRTSGKKGGAHEELDSDELMLRQIAVGIQLMFADRLIVYVGDPAISEDEMRRAGIKNLLYLGEFWNKEGDDYLHDGKNMFRDRNTQRYLFELFAKENKAVSIGMRSGSLEGMALLGLPVIFLDDMGNQAEGRMEFWAGEGAKDRRRRFDESLEIEQTSTKPEEGLEHFLGAETEKQGPLPNYRRVATRQKLGSEVDVRRTILSEIEKIAGDLRGDDKAGEPIVNEAGEGDRREMIGQFVGDELMRSVLADKELPTGPGDVAAVYSDVKKFTKRLRSVGPQYLGSTKKPRGTLKFPRASVDQLDRLLTTLRRLVALQPDEIAQILLLTHVLTPE